MTFYRARDKVGMIHNLSVYVQDNEEEEKRKKNDFIQAICVYLCMNFGTAAATTD